MRLTLLAILMWTVYAPTINYGFAYEDFNDRYLMRPQTMSTTAPMLASRDLTIRSVQASAALFGPSPWHWHLENVILHTLNGLLLYVIAMRLFANNTASLVSTGLFWLHPIQTESVAYISSRSELLMACGILLTLVCLLSRHRIVATVGTFLVGLLTLCTKEAAICLVALVPLLCWWSGAVSWRTWGPIVLSWKVLAVIAVWHNASFWALWAWMQAPGYDSHVAQQTAALWRLSAVVIWPFGLTVDHDFGATPIWVGTLAMILTLCLVMTLWVKRHTYPSVAFACAWVLLALLPRILLPSTEGFTEFLTEHHMLAPSIGLSLVAGSWAGSQGVCA